MTASSNLFDRTLKIIARNHADLFLRLAFPDLEIELRGTPENVELALPVQPVDFVHRALYAGDEYLMHVEFQLAHFADFPRRMCACHGALTQQFKLPVFSYALYLRYRAAPIPNEYTVNLGGRIVNRFTYPVIKLWDYVDEIASGKYRELAPLLVMLVEQPDEQILQRERELILAEPDAHKQADLLALAVAIASRSFDREFLRFVFRKELEQMQGATLLDEWIEERVQQQVAAQVAAQVAERLANAREQAREQGLQQGLQQGKLEQQRETILHTLQLRFPLSSEQFESVAERLAEVTEPSRLGALFDIALRAYTWGEFQTALNQATTSESTPR